MKKIFKSLSLGFFVLTFVVTVGANSADAVLTLSSVAVDSAAGDAMTIGASNTTGTIALGVANTGGITIGNGATIKTISIGAGNAVNTIKIGDNATPINVITLGGAASTLSIGATLLGASPLVFEGATANDFELTFAIPDVSADATITFPSATATLATLAGTETLTNKTLTSPILTTPALGTPSALVLTNATGLPAASVLAGSLGAGAYVISTSLQSATYELGHATDTTLSRVSAGLIAVEGLNIVDVSTAQTLTNKTLTAPVLTTPALGTPSALVLTSATGLPAASVLAGSFGAGAYVISTSLQSATYELGHATDTTLSRVSAGLIAVEGLNIVDVSTAQTLTNKTLTSPVLTTPAIGAATGASLVLTGAITVGTNVIISVDDTLTAVGTNQASALALTKGFNVVTVGATTTGVKLPVAVAGMDITVRNSVVNTIHIYSAVAETLNGTAGSVGLNLLASLGVRCVAMSTSAWICNNLGAITAL